MSTCTFRTADFFGFRTALLPFRIFEDWSRNLTLPEAGESSLESAVAVDEVVLRERLQLLLKDPVILEALLLASPDLVEALPYWQEAPTSTKGRRVERSLVKYLSRLCGRSTPFGLFAGSSLGRLGSHTSLAIHRREDYIRHTRPDMDYLCNLASVLAADPAIARLLTYTPNSSLYTAAGRLHYCESRQKGKRRTYHLVAVDPTDYLEALLVRAARGASFADLATSLVCDEISLEAAEAYVQELIESQILVSDLEPAVTGPEPLHSMIRTLSALPHEGAQLAAKVLAEVRDSLISIDASPLGVAPARYKGIAERLKTLPAPVEMNRLFQTDLVKPAPEAELGGEVLVELQSVVEALWRLPNRSWDPFKDFKQAFRSRYEEREVPLAEVLDEESGIGFGNHGGGEDSPLLEGLPLGGSAGESNTPWGTWETWLTQRLLEHQACGEGVLTLTLDELKPFLKSKLEQVPDAFSIIAKVVAKSPEAIEEGKFGLYVAGGSGPGGANLLGRFCHGDPGLTQQVEAYIRAEEAYRPESVYAEIVHLPEGRIGNVILRPVLRDYEVPFLGRSGADPEHQIPLTDLYVSLREGRIVLRSRRLGKEVLPRLTNAHNFRARGLGLYQFLCQLQFQSLASVVGWSWGPLNDMPFLPRVALGRTVLAKARWLVKSEELRGILEPKGAGRVGPLRAWVVQRRLPRFVLLADGDNKLPVDFHNILSIEVFLDLVEERPDFTLEELFPDSTELGAYGPEGTFVHELVVPFLTQREALVEVPLPRKAPPQLMRYFPPGSEWLYAKIYTGYAGADALLRGPLAVLVEEALDSGAADRWFFIRYSDPDHHLRLRFRGDPDRLCAHVLPRLYKCLKPHIASGLVGKFMLDTYARELERYGGDIGMPLCENIFQADSELTIKLLQNFYGEKFADQRWKFCLISTDRLLRDFGYNLSERLNLMLVIRDGYRIEFMMERKAEHHYGKRYREERRVVESAVLDLNASQFKEAFPFFESRSESNRAYVEELSKLKDPDSIVRSLIHMSSNRLLRSTQRRQEMAIADFLVRAYESQLARENAREKTIKPA